MMFQVCSPIQSSQDTGERFFDLKDPEAFVEVVNIQHNDKTIHTQAGKKRIKTFAGIITKPIKIGDVISDRQEKTFFRIIERKQTAMAALIKAEQVVV